MVAHGGVEVPVQGSAAPVANEGKLVVFVAPEAADAVLAAMQGSASRP